MLPSIRWRILIPYTILILLSFTGLGIYLSNIVHQTQLQNLETRLVDNALIISESLVNDLLSESLSTDYSDRARLLSEITGARVTIIDNEGIVLGESDLEASQMENHLNRPEIQEAILNGVGSSTRYSLTVKFEMLYVAVPIAANGTRLGFARVALPLEEIAVQRAQIRQTILIASLVTGSLAVILGFFIATLVTKPIRNLTQETQRMAKKDQIEQIPIKHGEEVGKLTQAFNLLVEKLQLKILALQSEQSTLNAILRQMTDGVLITDKVGCVTLINAAAEGMFPSEEETNRGHSLAEVLRHHQLIDLWQRCIDTQELQSAAIELPRKGTFIQSIAIPLGEDLPDHILMLFQDFTRIRRLETVRRDFISNISHELRTPLASLKALVETLRSGALEDPPAARRFLYRMETEVDALTHMVSELLELTRIESGQVPLKMKSVSPKKLLVKVKERLAVQAERKQLVIELNYAKKLPRVLADKPRLGQVMVNLLHNAIKFTPEGGEITLSAHQQDDMIQFSVKDTGSGIPADDLPRIFERFYKTDPARSGGGTGLGLAIARHLVEAHGGLIWAESIEGKGSTFHFSIPVVK